MWQLGEAWVKKYFSDHNPDAIAAARRNAGDCMTLIAQKISRLEKEAEINKALFDRALAEPDFGILLQKALIGASQTEDKSKHDLLATLLANRLTAETDSLYTVASHLACDAVVRCTPLHLRALGFAASVQMRFDQFFDINVPSQEFFQLTKEWFEIRYFPYFDMQTTMLDVFHLEAVSCSSSQSMTGNAVEHLLKRWSRGREFPLLLVEFASFSVAPLIQSTLKQGKLQLMNLTPAGTLLGTMVSDLLCGATPTSFNSWKAHIARF